ncbi:MAG: hypothetical protein M1826_005495 [Phylliscum demangeonii]|nr:MAG: hypothetical protein M1826_005495 [Phylliscum demangeonii]
MHKSYPKGCDYLRLEAYFSVYPKDLQDVRLRMEKLQVVVGQVESWMPWPSFGGYADFGYGPPLRLEELQFGITQAQGLLVSTVFEEDPQKKSVRRVKVDSYVVGFPGLAIPRISSKIRDYLDTVARGSLLANYPSYAFCDNPLQAAVFTLAVDFYRGIPRTERKAGQALRTAFQYVIGVNMALRSVWFQVDSLEHRPWIASPVLTHQVKNALAIILEQTKTGSLETIRKMFADRRNWATAVAIALLHALGLEMLQTSFRAAAAGTAAGAAAGAAARANQDPMKGARAQCNSDDEQFRWMIFYFHQGSKRHGKSFNPLCSADDRAQIKDGPDKALVDSLCALMLKHEDELKQKECLEFNSRNDHFEFFHAQNAGRLVASAIGAVANGHTPHDAGDLFLSGLAFRAGPVLRP